MAYSGVKYASFGAVYRQYASYAVRYPYLLTLTVFGTIGSQIMELVIPWYLRELINTLSANQPSADIVAMLLKIVALIAVIWLGRWALYRMRDWSIMHLEASVMRDIYVRTFEYLLRHSYSFFVSRFAGSLTHKVNKFSRAFEQLFDATTLVYIPTFIFVLGAAFVLFLRHASLGILLAVWCLAFLTFQVFVSIRRQPVRTKRSNAETRITASLADAISNHANVLQFSGVTHERTLFSGVVGDWHRYLMHAWRIDNNIWAAMGLFMLTINVSLLAAAVVLWSQGFVQVGDFILIQAYLFTTFERMMTINRELRRSFDAYADASEMVAILEEPHGVRDAPGAAPLLIREGKVAFERVSFHFHETRQVLHDLDLAIKPGEKVAIVGPSGAGKSTITKLMLRMYDISAGAISIDGQNIAHVTQDSLRTAISYVPQEPILFHRTLMENIRYGRRDASDTEVIEAAKKAHCHEFISQLPDGYNTYVGERGVKLSGGERQRVAIARAILKNAPILLLDEATSSLDSESEALIQDALTASMEGKTTIVIAHRLSTIMKMDRIVVVDHGTIVEEGTHSHLVERGGLYASLWSRQAGGFIPEEQEESAGLP